LHGRDDLEGLGLFLLVDTDKALTVHCASVNLDRLTTLLDDKAGEVKSGHLGHLQIFHSRLLDPSNTQLASKLIVIAEHEILDSVMPNELFLASASKP